MSSAAASVVDYAAGFANEQHAPLTIMHVVEYPVMYTDAPMTSVSDTVHQLEAIARKKINKLVKRLQKRYPDLMLDTFTMAGSAADAIVEKARSVQAGMIIMGSTGTTKFERLLLGSTASKVIRNAHCPVITVPSRFKFGPVNRIIFATDLNEDNLVAANELTPLARSLGAEIAFVFIDDKHIAHSQENIAEMTAKIKSKIKYPRIAGYIALDNSIEKGLGHFMDKVPGELLVLFTHPRRFPESLFVHSVTRTVAHQNRLPLLTIKPDEH